MLDLTSLNQIPYVCPECGADLNIGDWYIPGMRNLAELNCPDCQHGFYGDLPAGNAILTPTFVDRETEKTYAPFGGGWFSTSLASAYANRKSKERSLDITHYQDIDRPILVNCIDVNYGHCLYKLLAVGPLLDQYPERDVIVLIQRPFEWLVPDGVAAVWVLDLPLSAGGEWNDWLAREIKDRLDGYNECELSYTISRVTPPKPGTYSIERYTEVQPFPIGEWFDRFNELTVTFIWRELSDYSGIGRLWCSSPGESSGIKLPRAYYNRFCEVIGQPKPALAQQRNRFIETATYLRERFPQLNCAVAGIGEALSFPNWFNDCRVSGPDPASERKLCKQYAKSHLVIGVHGSNMLLPSAHAGSAISLLQAGRTGTTFSDLLLREDEQIGSHFRYQTPMKTTPPETVAEIAENILTKYARRRLLSSHRPSEDADITQVQQFRKLGQKIDCFPS